MADNKRTVTNATSDEKPATDIAKVESDVRGDHGEGILQQEPKPEDYPASAKITPPAEQINSTLSMAVGSTQDAALVDLVDESTREASDKINEAVDKTNARFADRSKDERAQG